MHHFIPKISGEKQLSQKIAFFFNKIRSGRLVFLFVACVLLPTIPLAYLSLQSIAGESEIISTRVNDHLERIGNAFTRMFTKPLLNCEAQFTRSIYSNLPVTEIIAEVMESTKACPYFASFFILDADLEPLFPFGEQEEELDDREEQMSTPRTPEIFSSRMRSGRRLEFVSKDYEGALDEYKMALGIANDTQSRAVALNATARCCFKMAQAEESLAYYGEILSINASNIFYCGLSMKLLAMYRMVIIEETMGNTSHAAGLALDIMRALADGELASNVYEASFYATMIRKKRHSLKGIAKLEPSYIDRFNEASQQWLTMQRAALSMESLRKECRYDFQKLFAEKMKDGEYFKTLSKTIGDTEYLVMYRLLNVKGLDKPVVLGINLDSNRLRREAHELIKDTLKTDSDVNIVVANSANHIIAEGGNPEESSVYEINRTLGPVMPTWQVDFAYKKDGLLFKVAMRENRIRLYYISMLIIIICLGLYMTYRSIKRDSELAKLKSDFVSRVSHELRTPLSTIRAVGEILEMGAVSSKQKAKEYFSLITTESERLSRLINNVLDFSKIGAGKRSYHLKFADIRKTVTNTVRAFKQYIKSEGFDIVYNHAGDIPKAWVDEDAVSQALINLMDNAVNFSRDQKTIWVDLFTTKEKDAIKISVIDKGIGIAPDEIDKVFNQFYRADISSELSRKGAGIGLSIVKHIAEAHGGKVDVKSKVGEGSVFTLTIPIKPIDSNKEGEE
jgi:signal transduction histidine kinase/tetratricopeptide (TPR) repeat protein